MDICLDARGWSCTSLISAKELGVSNRHLTELWTRARGVDQMEIQKLLDIGFIRPIQHPTWVTNIVSVKKVNIKIRYCIDFCDLNKTCQKDEFPLANIDMLVDAIIGHSKFSFMDGFSGYNQIRIDPLDAEKTAFQTSMDNFHYIVILSGSKTSVPPANEL